MNLEEAEKLLINEAKNKNAMAESLLSLMNSSTPEMKSYLLDYLVTMMTVFDKAMDEKQQNNAEKS